MIKRKTLLLAVLAALAISFNAGIVCAQKDSVAASNRHTGIALTFGMTSPDVHALTFSAEYEYFVPSMKLDGSDRGLVFTAGLRSMGNFAGIHYGGPGPITIQSGPSSTSSNETFDYFHTYDLTAGVGVLIPISRNDTSEFSQWIHMRADAGLRLALATDVTIESQDQYTETSTAHTLLPGLFISVRPTFQLTSTIALRVDMETSALLIPHATLPGADPNLSWFFANLALGLEMVL